MHTLDPELAMQLERGLTPLQYYVMRFIDQHGPSTVSELAVELGVKPSAVTAIVDRMMSNELVLRERDEADRRVVRITMSEIGLQIFAESEEKRKLVFERYLRYFSHEELATFTKLFEKLSNILQIPDNNEEPTSGEGV